MSQQNMKQVERMKVLIDELNHAAKVYYQGQDEIMSNYEYDKKYDELLELEKITGITMSVSPTIHVGYETLSELPKEQHISPMLSLEKTKEVPELVSWLGEHEGMLSLKLDGLSIILTYEGGQLTKALTRGNGEIGEVITNNARTFINIPHRISCEDTLVVRGEALILYSDFYELNHTSKEIHETYKNPRNLCSGSVRQLNNEITARRRVRFYAYNIISAPEQNDFTKKEQGIRWLKSLGFDVAPYHMVNADTLADAVSVFSEEVTHSDIPSDGLVLTYNDVAYSRSLGRTAKYPKDSMAFKWQDELAETVLREVEWSASRTGLINPVAIFDPVELEGTTVSRASVHNLSILRQLELGIGDHLMVYKANMIIPQIYENLTKSGNCPVPEHCPVCGEKTEEITENGSTVLQCPNRLCYAKKIKSFSHFVSRDAMNIDGLSEATLEKMVNMGALHHVTDLFELEKYRDDFIELDGFGEKSFDNLIHSIEEAKHVNIANFIYSLGIKGIGLSTAKLITGKFNMDVKEYLNITKEELMTVDGVGEVLAESFTEYFAQSVNQEQITKLCNILDIQYPQKSGDLPLEGKVFVITGSLTTFSNRSECKEQIENAGGKVTGTVSKNTDYLVNNDIESTSSKNKKAKELGVPIITEQELLAML